MSDAATKGQEEVVAKKESPIGFIILLVVLSLIALGAGWFVAGQLHAPSMMKTETSKEQKPKIGEENKEEVAGEEDGEAVEEDVAVKLEPLILEPIIISLQKSENTFMRLELAVIPEDGSDVDNQETRLRLRSDIAAFAQTLTLEQISGPSGYLHFHEDILDRARLITDGQIKDVLIMSLVAE